MVDFDEMFRDAIGDSLDSLGDTIDSLNEDTVGYTGASKRQEMKEQHKRMMAKERDKVKKERKKLKDQLDSLPRDIVDLSKTLAIQTAGRNSNNISLSGSESVSISGTNGNLTMKIGNMRENTFKHKLVIREPNTDTTTTVRYYDENNFSASNDEHSGSLNVNDASLKAIKRHIRDDIRRHDHDDLAGLHDKAPDHAAQLRKLRKLANMVAPPPIDEELFREIELRDTEESFGDPIFLERTWGGESGLPIEFDEDAKVTVSAHNVFGRKYGVKINGIAIYVPTVEDLMDYCWIGDHLDAFIEMRSPAEKVILLKIIDGLIALEIAEPHHTGIKQLL